MVWRGLLQYGFTTEATELAEKTVLMFERDLADCGQLHEYYDPETAEPVNNIGFQSWNLLAVNMKAWLEGDTPVSEF